MKNSKLADLLRERRLRAGLNAVELAKKARVSNRTILDIESGRLEKTLKNFSNGRKRLLAYSVGRLAFCFREDPAHWQRLAGLPELQVIVKTPLDIVVTAEDLKFLSSIQKRMNKPLPISLIMQLLSIRKSS